MICNSYRENFTEMIFKEKKITHKIWTRQLTRYTLEEVNIFTIYGKCHAAMLLKLENSSFKNG